MERHLEVLVGILIMHVVNDVHSVDIDIGKPVHHLFVFLDHVIKSEHFAIDPTHGWTHLIPTDLVPASINGVEQTLGQVGSSAEKLHLLSHQHRGHTTGNGPVVAPSAAHHFVAFELKGTSVD